MHHHPRPGLDAPPASSAAVRAALACILGASVCACNAERKAECDAFLGAMKPLDQGVPTAETVDRVRSQVEGLKLTDQPLSVYAKNYAHTLTVLSSTLKLKEGPSPPDGTDDVVKTNLKAARTDSADTARYCAQ